MSFELSLPNALRIVKPELLVFAGCMPIFRTNPIPIMEDSIELKPLLKNGRGSPVFGKILVATHILANTWNIKIGRAHV